MKCFQSSLAIIGILCAVIFVGCGNDDDDDDNYDNEIVIDTAPPRPTKIAFESNRDGNAEIYVMNADGTNQVNITNNPGDDYSPNWSFTR